MDVQTLHIEIAKVCPITSTRIGVEDDRTTWSFDPEEGATQEQIDAGQNVIDTIDVDYKPLPEPDPHTVTAYDHENRLRTLEGAPPLTLGDFVTQKAKMKVK